MIIIIINKIKCRKEKKNAKNYPPLPPIALFKLGRQ